MADPELLRVLDHGVDAWNNARADGRREFDPLWQAPDLTEADLAGRELSGIWLSRCMLWSADLSGAILVGASLGEAEFGGADLTGANLTDADLSRATFVTVMRSPDGELQDVSATADSTTRWPADFDPTAAGVRNLDNERDLAEALRATLTPRVFTRLGESGDLFDEPVWPISPHPPVFSARAARLDGATVRKTVGDLEPLIDRAQRILDDPSIALDGEAEHNLRASLDTLRGELRNTDPDPVILERAVARVIGFVAPEPESLNLIADVAKENGLGDDEAFDLVLDMNALIQASQRLGAESADDDVSIASDAQIRYERVDAAFPVVSVAMPLAKPERLSAKLRKLRTSVAVGAATTAGGLATKAAVDNFAAIVQAIEALFRFFA